LQTLTIVVTDAGKTATITKTEEEPEDGLSNSTCCQRDIKKDALAMMAYV
jgi:hypothetical protein